jgi:hypothetical protein
VLDIEQKFSITGDAMKFRLFGLLITCLMMSSAYSKGLVCRGGTDPESGTVYREIMTLDSVVNPKQGTMFFPESSPTARPIPSTCAFEVNHSNVIICQIRGGFQAAFLLSRKPVIVRVSSERADDEYFDMPCK